MLEQAYMFFIKGVEGPLVGYLDIELGYYVKRSNGMCYHTPFKDITLAIPLFHYMDSAVVAIQFALQQYDDQDLRTVLRLWNEGEFDSVREEWPDAPDEMFRGADTLLDPQDPDWTRVKTIREMRIFYKSILDNLRVVAMKHGYALTVHGSMERDLDLVAIPWVEEYCDPDTLAHLLAEAACGMSRKGPYVWELKPGGRVATSIPVVWTADCPELRNVPNAGHIDLSVVTWPKGNEQ